MSRTFSLGFFADPEVTQAIETIALAQELTFFAGAGVSADQNIPTWSSLVQSALQDSWSLAKRAGRLSVDADLDFGDIVNKSFQLPAASIVDQLYDEGQNGRSRKPQQYRNGRLRRLIYGTSAESRNLYRNRKSLARQLLVTAAKLKQANPEINLVILTTNYDDLLYQVAERDADLAAILDGIQVKRYDKDPPKRADEIPIVHVHGFIPSSGPLPTAEDPWRPVFSEADYVWWSRHGAIRDYVAKRFDRGTTLMLGASLRDYNIVSYLKTTQIEDGSVRRFAILPTCDDPLFQQATTERMDALEVMRSARGKQLGVDILSPNYFSQVSQFLVEIENYAGAAMMGRQYIPYLERLASWWSSFSPTFQDHDQRVNATRRLRGLSQEMGARLEGDLQGVLNLKLELWVRSDQSQVTNARHLELWASSQFEYLAGRPTWPKHISLGGIDSGPIVDAFAVGDFVLPDIPSEGRWLYTAATPITLIHSPNLGLPVGVMALSVHSDADGYEGLKDALIKNRDWLNQKLSQLGRDILRTS